MVLSAMAGWALVVLAVGVFLLGIGHLGGGGQTERWCSILGTVAAGAAAIVLAGLLL